MKLLQVKWLTEYVLCAEEILFTMCQFILINFDKKIGEIEFC